MALRLNSAKFKRFFSVPCAIVDEYIKLADAAALKLILFLLCDESDPSDKDNILKKTGLSSESFDDAVSFWRQLGVIETDGEAPKKTDTAPQKAAPPADGGIKNSPTPKLVHFRYTPKDISEMLDGSDAAKELFSEAERTLGRVLKHSDHETLINLTDYYGFPAQSVILLLEYCRDMGKTSARYIQTVASDFSENGMVDFMDIDAEIGRRKAYNEFESKAVRALKLDAKPTPRQSKYIASWRDMGFDSDMISAARERCVDSINKLSFEYIDKILSSWAEKKIFKTEDIASETKPENKSGSEERSFSIDEFDNFTLFNKPTLKEK